MNKTLEVLVQDSATIAKAFGLGVQGALLYWYANPSLCKMNKEAAVSIKKELNEFVTESEAKGIPKADARRNYCIRIEASLNQYKGTIMAGFLTGSFGNFIIPGLIWSSLNGMNYLDHPEFMMSALPLMAATNTIDAISLYAKSVKERSAKHI